MLTYSLPPPPLNPACMLRKHCNFTLPNKTFRCCLPSVSCNLSSSVLEMATSQPLLDFTLLIPNGSNPGSSAFRCEGNNETCCFIRLLTVPDTGGAQSGSLSLENLFRNNYPHTNCHLLCSSLSPFFFLLLFIKFALYPFLFTFAFPFLLPLFI